MAHAYTPGLTVTGDTIYREERRLPLTGEVIVKEGQKVAAEDIVARTDLPGNVHPINVVQKLNILPSDIKECMLVKEGDEVERDQEIAFSTSFFGLFRNSVRAPVKGTIESISEVTGQVMLREAPIPVELKAFVDGEVEKVIEGEGVVLRARACFIQGIFGIGGETVGTLAMLVDSPDAQASEDDIDESMRGKVVVVGSIMTRGIIDKAIRCGVKGIIGGGINDQDLKEFLGYDLGVAITGSEEKGVTLVVTEGFGRIRMADKTFGLLSENDGRKVSISGATQIRAGVIRPKIIIPHEDPGTAVEEEHDEEGKGMEIGSVLRIIREPHFGELARVVSLPVELTPIPTEAKVRVVEIELLESGERMTIPRANVELIQE